MTDKHPAVFVSICEYEKALNDSREIGCKSRNITWRDLRFRFEDFVLKTKTVLAEIGMCSVSVESFKVVVCWRFIVHLFRFLYRIYWPLGHMILPSKRTVNLMKASVVKPFESPGWRSTVVWLLSFRTYSSLEERAFTRNAQVWIFFGPQCLITFHHTVGFGVDPGRASDSPDQSAPRAVSNIGLTWSGLADPGYFVGPARPGLKCNIWSYLSYF